MRNINLLPPELAERRRARRQASLLVVLGVVWLVLLAGLWMFRNLEVSRQDRRLEAAQAQAQQLEAQVAALREFADLEASIRQRQQTLAAVMQDDVHWSRLLIELSMTIPGDSWLTSFNGNAVPAEPQLEGLGPTLGSVDFVAVTFDFPGVARWLSRLQDLRMLQNIWVPSATKGQIAGRTVVNFSSTADLSQDAASKRYEAGTP